MKTWKVIFWGTIALVVLNPSRVARGDQFERREGTHIRLITDLPASPSLEKMVQAFDAAVPLWEEFWNLPSGSLADWKVDAYVMRNAEAFESAGLIDPRVPAFAAGYALGNRVWIRAQPSDYYTRHLVLHEGAHAVALESFSGFGPTWFMEGSAEMLATHQFDETGLQINQVPHDRDAYPYWGRFKRMKQLRQAERIPTIETVMKYRPSLRGDVEAYSWSWAAAKLLHAYPEYREVFIEAARRGNQNDLRFNRKLYQQLAEQWPIISARWRVLAEDFDYGYEFERERIAISRDDPLWKGEPKTIAVKADLGWQSIGVRIPAGVMVQINASGRVSVDDVPKPWISEPAGVTIEYHEGRPLGQLLVRVLPNAVPVDEFLSPLQTSSVGQQASIQVKEASWLLLRVNDRPDSLSNNTGHYTVKIQWQREPT